MNNSERANRVERVVQVIEYLADPPDECSLSDISRELGLAASSTHDLLKAMLVSGLIVNGEDRQFRLAPRSIRLGLRIAAQVDVDNVTTTHVVRLVERVRQDVYVASRVGNDVMYIGRYDGPQPVRLGLRLREPVALHSTAVGKLITAFDPELEQQVLAGELVSMTPSTITDPAVLALEFKSIRETGISVSREENLRGIIAIAAPVRGGQERVSSAIAVSALAVDMPESRIPSIARMLAETTQAIEFTLGSYAAPDATSSRVAQEA
ncbi:IclR family transcriptional regulator [Nocardioides halotolerans]|uniref:IclR family transcriptional regulator n=1 Tax=Nocardioides halotolerans TaxID=433660 RepID=UPI00048D15A6|nr:IclR family transcriptional regulator [Nocardioides halotolerans]